MSGKSSGSGPGRSRATLVLGLLVAAEAVFIGALILSRPVPADSLGDGATRAEPAGPAPAQFALPAPADGPTDQAAPDPLLAAAARNGQAARPLAAAGPTLDGVGILLCGTVRSAAGEPIESAAVGLKRGENDDWLSVTQGRYAVAGMPPGRWSIQCTAEGFNSQEAELDLDASRPLERLDFVLEPALTVSVRFELPDGASLVDALVQAGFPNSLRAVATREAPALGAPWPEATVSDWNETADSRDTFDGTLALTAPLPVFVSALWNTRVAGTQPITAPGQTAVFVFPLGLFEADMAGVDGRVVDAETHAPVEGVLVMVGHQHAATDGFGNFTIAKLLPDHYDLKLEPPLGWAALPGGGLMITHEPLLATYTSDSIALELRSGERLHLGDVPLEATVDVTGHVVVDGGPVTALQVDARPADGPETAAGRRRSRHVDVGADGRFSLRLKPGRWTLRAFTESAESPVLAIDARRGIGEVTLRLAACFEVRFELACPDPTRARTLVLLDASGVEVHRLACGGDLPVPPAWILRLPDGRYACEVRNDDGQPLWNKALAVRGEAVQLAVPLN